MKGFEFWAQRLPYNKAIGLTMAERLESGARAVVTALTVTAVEEGMYVEPSLKLTLEEAQALVDELWSVGIRPSEGTGSAGSLAATERHLADMRAIAFGALNSDGFKKP